MLYIKIVKVVAAIRNRYMRCAEFEFRGGDFSNSSHGRIKGSRAPLETGVWIMLVSTRRSRGVEKGREDLPLLLLLGKNALCFVCALTPLPESPDTDSESTLSKL